MSDDDLHVTVFADDARLESLSAYSDHIDELAAVFADASAGDGALLDHHPLPMPGRSPRSCTTSPTPSCTQSVRLRRLLVEDDPDWGSWDGEAYAGALGYDVRPPADALTLVLALRHVNVRLLASLSADQWRRTTEHPEEGPIDVARVVELIVEHTKLHVLQARRAVIGMT